MGKKRGRYKNTLTNQIENNKKYIGTKVGHLTILDVKTEDEAGKGAMFLVQCDCGAEPYLIRKTSLLDGQDNSTRCCKACRGSKISQIRGIYDKSVSIGKVNVYALLRIFRAKIRTQNLTATEDFLSDISTTDMENFKAKILRHFPTIEQDYSRRGGLTFGDNQIASWDTLHYTMIVLPYEGSEYTLPELSKILGISAKTLDTRIKQYGVERLDLVLSKESLPKWASRAGSGEFKKIVGGHFGHITVLRKATKEECENNKRAYSDDSRRGYYVYRCGCTPDIDRLIRGQHLLYNHITSCGCDTGKTFSSADVLNEWLIGKKFNALTVLHIASDEEIKSFDEEFETKYISYKEPVYVAECECGELCLVSKSQCFTGNKKSCGCLINNPEVWAERSKARVKKLKDKYVGQHVGRLTILDVFSPKDIGSKEASMFFLVQCDCGSEPYLIRTHDLFGKTEEDGGYPKQCAKCTYKQSGRRRRKYGEDILVSKRWEMCTELRVMISVRDIIKNNNMTVDEGFGKVIYGVDYREFARILTRVLPDYDFDKAGEEKYRLSMKDYSKPASWDNLTYYATRYTFLGKTQTITEWSEETGISWTCLYKRIQKYGEKAEHLILHKGTLTKKIVDNYWMSLGRNVDVTDPIGKIVMKGDLGSDTELHMNELEEASPKRDKPTLLQRQFKQVFSK